MREHLGNLSPEALTRDRCRWYATTRQAQGRRGASGRGQPLSAGTVIRELVTLRAALRWARGEKWITEEPYIEVPSAPVPTERWLTREEFARLLAAAESGHLRLYCILGVHTAARKSALLELQWSQVDFQANIIALRHGVGNKRRATVPMTPTLRAALLATAQHRVTDYVIEFRGKPVSDIIGAFRRAVRAAGLAGRVTPHVLRHTGITWVIQGGASKEEAAKFAADSVETIEKVYWHHSPEFLRGAVAALEG